MHHFHTVPLALISAVQVGLVGPASVEQDHAALTVRIGVGVGQGLPKLPVVQ